MKKQLINRQNIENFICLKEKRIYVDQSMILSPGGKDYLNEKGIEAIYDAKPVLEEKKAPSGSRQNDALLLTTISDLLQRDYGIKDSRQESEIIKKVMERFAQTK